MNLRLETITMVRSKIHANPLAKQMNPIHEYVLNPDTMELSHREYYQWEHVGDTRVTPENITRITKTGKNRLFRFQTKSSSRLINECDMDIVKNNRLLTFNTDIKAIKNAFIKHYTERVKKCESELQKEQMRLYAVQNISIS